MAAKAFTIRYYVGTEESPRSVTIRAWDERDARGVFAVMRERNEIPGLAPAGH